ncbi:site-2 protease family protein [Pseudalkalibacillus decolorationis]|uniref:site-2 protease family protein n=1 Tax=Pseudalkalibacillus decolorationis TaxID=163879 RepID=UPI0021484812|nr:site-2 protease family protein [Pseudalkalibacillus decolorationis]
MANTNTAKRLNLGWLAAIAIFLVSKFKWVIAVLKLAKFSTLISLFISLGAYAVFYGWKFAVAVIYLLFVHEMGHLVAAKQKGIKTSPAIFIPFMGAVIGMKERPKTAKDESYIAYGGPLAGVVSIVPALILYSVTQHEFWALVILLGAMLNLFNLVPVSPLDGGRILSVVSTKIWFFGLLIMGVYLFFNFHVMIVLILLFGLQTLNHQYKERTQLKVDQYGLDRRHELNGKIRALQEKNETDPMTMSWFEESEFQKCKANIGEIEKINIPWFTKSRRLKRGRLEADKAILLSYYQLLKKLRIEEEGKQKSSFLQEALVHQHHEIEKLEKSVEEKERYYRATPKEKMIALGAYLLLAAVLTGLWWFGEKLLTGLTTF